jgi:23S rRNA (adenine2503-C2)-methyltransferase
MKSNTKKILLKDLRFQELQHFIESLDESKFRAKQIFNWIYENLASDFSEMSNLPSSLIEKLSHNSELNALRTVSKQESDATNTIKFLFETFEGNKIESVLIPENKRQTLCISTQVGCPLDCKFCATGLMGFTRNLSTGEIIDQYLKVSKEIFPSKITNIVYMGMGEPLLNYKATERSLQILLHDLGNKIGRTRITVSTAGIPNKIRELADSGTRVKLALSLHSCFDDIRNKIMPINTKYNIGENIDALSYYADKTKTKIMFEYTMLKDINDRDEDLNALIRLCSRLPSKVNIIPFNSIAHMVNEGFSSQLQPTPMDRVKEFSDRIMNKNIFVMLRDTQGDDIAAACGQLAIKNI